MFVREGAKSQFDRFDYFATFSVRIETERLGSPTGENRSVSCRTMWERPDIVGPLTCLGLQNTRPERGGEWCKGPKSSFRRLAASLILRAGRRSRRLALFGAAATTMMHRPHLPDLGRAENRLKLLTRALLDRVHLLMPVLRSQALVGP